MIVLNPQVDTARKRKQKRLKQAKDEAQAEVEAYRSEREGTYKERETAHMGSRGDLEAKINGQTDIKLQEVDAAFQSKIIGKNDGGESMVIPIVSREELYW